MANTVNKAIRELDKLRDTLEQLANNLGIGDNGGRGLSGPKKRTGGSKPRKRAKPRPR